jgi:hypothetical protein
MPRFLLVVFAVALLVLPATAQGQSSSRLRGTVALKSEANQLVTVRTKRQAVALRVPGSMSRIRVGQRVELRGSTLRAHGHGSRVLARNVSIVSSQSLPMSSSPRSDDDEQGDDEVEIKGKLTSLAPLTVTSAARSVTCSVPSAGLLAGFSVGDFVEITCDRIGDSWVLRKLKHEDLADVDDDDDDEEDEDEDDDHSGSGGGDDDDSSGHGSGDDDDD